MTANMIAPHVDYVLFVHTLSLIFLSAYSLQMFRRASYLPWLWLCLGAVTLALAEGLHLITHSQDDRQLATGVYWSLRALAFFFFTNFGLHALAHGWSRHLRYIITGLVLVLPASASVLLGYQGFMLSTEMGLGALAGVLTLAGAIKQFKNHSRSGLSGLFFPLLGAYAVALALLPAVYMLVTGLASDWQSPESLMGMPVYALATTVLAAAAAAALAHAAVFRSGEGRETTGLHAYIIGLSAVGVAVFMGFTITDTLGERVDTTLRKELFMRVSAVGNALDPNLVGMLQGREEDVKEPPYKTLLERLTKIRLANDDLRFVYLTTMRMKDRAIIIILDTEPPTSKDYAKPGELYSEAPAELKEVFSSGRAALVGPYRDRWGTWISGFAPIKNHVGAILGVVGMDISAQSLQAAVASNRLVGIVIAFLLALVGAGLGIIIQDNKGLAAYNLLLQQEINDRLAAQESLAESEEKYRNLVERANDGIAIVVHGDLKYCNPRLGEMLGRDMGEHLGRPWVEMAPESHRPQLAELYNRRIRGEDAPGGFSTTLMGSLGKPVPVEISASITPYQGEPAILLVIRDITLRKQVEEQLRLSRQRYKELSIRDDLTALFNSRHFQDQIQAEVSRAERYDHRLSLVLVDLDHFKEVNDTHGHLEGDRVLTEVGRLIMETVRATDMAFRYGGDEFAIILPETDIEEGRNLAERLRAALAGHRFDLADHTSVHITASLGIAVHQDGEKATAFIRRADQNMYLAKQQGMDKTVGA